MEDLIRQGIVSSINKKLGMARVTYPDRDDMVTDYLPILSVGGEFKMPKVGDKALVAHLSDGTEAGVILGSYWDGGNKPPQGEGLYYYKDFGPERGEAYVQYTSDRVVKLSAATIVLQADTIELHGNLSVRGGSATLDAASTEVKSRELTVESGAVEVKSTGLTVDTENAVVNSENVFLGTEDSGMTISGSGVSISTPELALEGDVASLTAETITLSGNAEVTGDLTSANLTTGVVNADSVQTTDLAAENVSASTDVSSGNISLLNHIHKDSLGGDTTRPE